MLSLRIGINFEVKEGMNRFFHNTLKVCLILFCWGNGTAQISPIDSLKELVNASQQADTVRLELLKELADEYYEVDFDSILHYYGVCLELSQSLPHYEIGLSTLRSFGYVYSFRKNNYEKALEYFELAQQLAQEEKDSSGLALAYSDMGRIYWKKGQSAKAMEHHLTVRKIGEQLSSTNILLRANLSLGLIHNEEGENEKALAFYADALTQADSLENLVGKGLILNNIGKVYQDQERYPEALEYFEKANTIFSEMQRSDRLGLIHFNIGKNYVLQENYKEGLTFYKKALDFNSKIDDQEQRTMIYSGIASAMLNMGNYTQAIANARKGLATIENVETDLYREELYKTMADSYEQTGNYKKSLEAYQSYLEAKDKINREETTQKIEELKALYEQQKNETAIQKLNLEKEKNARRLDQSQAFVKLLLALVAILIIAGILFFVFNRMRLLKQFDLLKTKLSKDLHDNIGASLNHIKMLSGRLVRNNNLQEEEQEDVQMIKKISNELMFDLYDMLWVLDKEKSTVGDLIGRMRDHIDNTLHAEGYTIQTNFKELNQTLILPLEIKTNVYAIFKEAVQNILKHTTPNSVSIKLESKKRGKLFLSLRNEFEEKISDPPFSSKRGLENMRKRAKEINGELKIKEQLNSFEVHLEWKI